ncbi:phytanoyl-CoA dioxygenase family protein [Streptomyces anulatus]
MVQGLRRLLAAGHRGRRIVGFLLGYRRPEEPDTYFVWQTAVSPRHGIPFLGVKLFEAAADRQRERGARYVEATVSAEDKAILMVLKQYARKRSAEVADRVLFPSGWLGEGHHDEVLHRIGPLDRTPAQRIPAPQPPAPQPPTHQPSAHQPSAHHVFDNLLTAEEVGTYRAELQRLSEDSELLASERVVLEPDSDRLRSVFEVEKVSELFAGLLASPRLTDVARQVLGSDVYVHQSRVNYKPGFGGAEFDWHSDFETWHAEDGMPRPRAFSVSIALSENYEFNGPLMVMPGTHKTFVPSSVRRRRTSTRSPCGCTASRSAPPGRTT